jgi:hypothetical protein
LALPGMRYFHPLTRFIAIAVLGVWIASFDPPHATSPTTSPWTATTRMWSGEPPRPSTPNGDAR